LIKNRSPLVRQPIRLLNYKAEEIFKNLAASGIVPQRGRTLRQGRSLVPDAKVLFKWGIGLMRTAALNAPRRAGLLQYRDGLLIAMFASRARRGLLASGGRKDNRGPRTSRPQLQGAVSLRPPPRSWCHQRLWKALRRHKLADKHVKSELTILAIGVKIYLTEEPACKIAAKGDSTQKQSKQLILCGNIVLWNFQLKDGVKTA
jgi:hypothetical protein